MVLNSLIMKITNLLLLFFIYDELKPLLNKCYICLPFEIDFSFIEKREEIIATNFIIK